jgi:hypothetical protein
LIKSGLEFFRQIAIITPCCPEQQIISKFI